MRRFADPVILDHEDDEPDIVDERDIVIRCPDQRFGLPRSE
jgi:hypothetical protein